MKTHIITIGDEILLGQTLNTNAAYIGSKLSEIQMSVPRTSVVGDVEEDLKTEIESAYKENDVLILTGGLGPTHDDITRKCIVDFFDTELVANENVLSDIKQMFEKRGRKLTKVNEEQALLPKIAQPIRNSRGTAPGQWIEKKGKILIALPGVPYEMKGMMDDYVIPKLKEMIEGKIKPKIIKNLLTTGIPESYLYDRLNQMKDLPENVKVAFLPNQFGVKMRISVSGETQEEASNQLTKIEQEFRAKAGRYIYGKDDETLEEVVARLLIDRGIKIAVAESCTGGLISNRLTNVSGSSVYFERGIISYSNGAKVELLKIEEDLLEKYGAVSLEVARLMSEGVRAVSGTDIGIASTGIMGPTGATETKPIGLVYIGICDEKICTAKEFRFGDDRLLNKDRTSQAAIEMLRRHLLGIPYDE